MSDLQPYDITRLVVGAVRVLRAPTTVGVPVKINDIIEIQAADAYAPQTGWIDFGAAKEQASYGRGIESEGLEIQQETGAILEEITAVNRRFTISMAEIDEDSINVLEDSAAAQETTAAGVGQSAQEAQPFGSITDLTPYRIAMIGLRKEDSGLVTEVGGGTRGRFVAVVLSRCTLAADESEVAFEKGALTDVPVTFTAYPESGQAAGEEYGRWMFEKVSTITA